MTSDLVDLAKRGLQNPSAVLPYLRTKLLQKTWRTCQSLGLHVVPNDFYYPIPDTDDLRQKQPWNEEYPTTGVDLQEGKQLELLNDFEDYFSEYDFSEEDEGFVTHGDGPVLYAMVRQFKPDRIIEVGLGESTEMALAASRRNERDSGTLTKIKSIDQYHSEK